jgi:hypothetical protein
MKRRDFFIRMGGAALAVPFALKLGACSDDTTVNEPDANVEPDAPQGLCANGTTVEYLDDPHGHVLEVTTEDIEAGVEKVYDIQGESLHPHTVTLTAAHFQALANGESVEVTSTVDAAHDHMMRVVCA